MAGERIKQIVLTLPLQRRDTQDFARVDGKRHVLDLARGQAIDCDDWLDRLEVDVPFLRVCVLEGAANHKFDKVSFAYLPGFELANVAAISNDRTLRADLFDLLELVTDVDNARALIGKMTHPREKPSGVW